MKKIKPLLILLLLLVGFSCKKDDAAGCASCYAFETGSFEVCQERNGNASVNGQDTGVPYDVYISDLLSSGADCSE